MRYDFSLDVGQSLKSEEAQEKKPDKAEEPVTGEELSARRVEEEIKKEPENQENADSEDGQEDPDDTVEDSDDEPLPDSDVKVKEISFDKAKLLEEHAKAQKIVEQDSGDEDEEDAGHPPDEKENDVNEFLEDSFSKENGSYAGGAQKKESSGIWHYTLPALLILFIISLSLFGLYHFQKPGSGVTAAVPDEIALEPSLSDVAVDELIEDERGSLIEDAEPEKEAVPEEKEEPREENKTVVDDTVIIEKRAVSADDALSDLVSGLKD